ncbi:MAG: proline--tRNA ligase, partial [Oscillospiraceae bacterium]|nr:proline--tRNA ligase [Oscillospiraceae bacterium]
DITFSDKNNKLAYPHQTSWGFSTRTIGGIIMTHGDDSGLVLPPGVAPVQVVVVPVASHKPGVREKAGELLARLKGIGLRAKLDDSDNSPGWKFAEHEMRGVPVRIELGPKDIEAGQCIVVRRPDGERLATPLLELEARLPAILGDIHNILYARAKENLVSNTRRAETMAEIKNMTAEKAGFIKTAWCGNEVCEVKMKEDAGLSSRCLSADGERVGDTCPVCGGKADKTVVWGVAY